MQCNALQILVCSLVTTALKHCSDALTQAESYAYTNIGHNTATGLFAPVSRDRPDTAGAGAGRVVAAVAALDSLTAQLRANKLHFLLMAHVFWYIRDQDSLKKVRPWCDCSAGGTL